MAQAFGSHKRAFPSPEGLEVGQEVVQLIGRARRAALQYRPPFLLHTYASSNLNIHIQHIPARAPLPCLQCQLCCRVSACAPPASASPCPRSCIAQLAELTEPAFFEFQRGGDRKSHVVSWCTRAGVHVSPELVANQRSFHRWPLQLASLAAVSSSRGGLASSARFELQRGYHRRCLLPCVLCVGSNCTRR